MQHAGDEAAGQGQGHLRGDGLGRAGDQGEVLISGAGIGGLAAARAVIADGHEVTVFEQATELRHGGAAVTLWSNGTGVLSELGVHLDEQGALLDATTQRWYAAM